MTGRARPIALLFPGQGSQHLRMAAGLYDTDEVFTTTMDTAFELLGTEGGRIRADWLNAEAEDALDDITRAQPLLYAIGCALGRLVCAWGIEPGALLGHSVGEMVAATLAGIFDFERGIVLMRERIGTIARTAPGGMLAVAASAEQLRPYLFGDVAIAAVNAPRQTMLAGPAGQLGEVERMLRAADVTCRPVKARQAFHSPLLAEASASSIDAWRSTRLRAPARRLYSGYRGELMTEETALDPWFWTTQPADPVYFGPALDALLADGDHLLVEVGPGHGLTMIARWHPAVSSRRSAVVPLLPARSGDPFADIESVHAAAERIRAEGHEIREALAPLPAG